ncbi:MAG: OmpA family protein [Actinobacteria bacterium]|nr:OmpA family protein [Actinomycetota bacterium]
MTRKALPLLILVAAVLVSGTFAGCGPKKQDQITALQVENANLKGQLRNQDGFMEDIQSLESEVAQAKQEAQDARMELARAKSAAPAVASGQNVVMNVPGSVLFAAGSDKLTAAGKKELDGIVRTLQGQYAGHRISIEGHTDNTPLVRTKAKWHTNLWLSANRARSVADYLISRGIPENSISIVGHGAGKSKGRLVEIVVLSR